MSEAFDWRNPDYLPIIRRRLARYDQINRRIQKERDAGLPPTIVPALSKYYASHPWDYINDWGVTFDPRNAERGLPSVVPFVLFPKQREWVEWLYNKWKSQEPGLTEKSRDMGCSWLTVGFAATLCMFNPGLVIGFGSRKEEYVDKMNSPKSLFWKAKQFIIHSPDFFRGSWNERENGNYMRITFPTSNSYMTGEAGDNIGRGDRASIYFVDEAAYLERPEVADAALSQTTNCRIDLSSVNGMANSFAQKRHSWPDHRVFTFHWRDDPRKDEAWYAKQVDTLSPIVVAQEIDINYYASAEGMLIPAAWVTAAVDAHKKLGIEPTGKKLGAFDVADEGEDKNAMAGNRGILLTHLEQWTGQGSDIFNSTEKAINYADQWGLVSFLYDADGLGSGVKGDARVVNQARKQAGVRMIPANPFRGSGAVEKPEQEMVPERKNKDFFANLKAQAWWALRLRFKKTFEAVTEGLEFKPNEIISLSSELPLLKALISELSQPTYSLNGVGKVVVDKTPEGAKSPNLADAVNMLYSQFLAPPLNIDPSLPGRIAKMGIRR